MASEALAIRTGVLRNHAAWTKSVSFAAVQGSQRYRWLHTRPEHRVQAYGIPPALVVDSMLKESTSIVHGVPERPSPASLERPVSATSHLSFPALLKTYMITACTSSPFLITQSIRILSAIAYSKSIWLSPDKNPVLHWLLKKTVYRHFCAGENAAEVRATISHLQSTGIKGIILCYAREVEMRGNQQSNMTEDTTAEAEAEINSWAKGIIETLRVIPEDNFISIKFSGAGTQTLHCLQNSLPPPPSLAQHLQQICTLAQSKRVKICIDAEQSVFQPGIDAWTMDLQRQFNTTSINDKPGAKPWACVYNTYQCYLRNTPATLSKHIQIASQESFALGVKLVRGAYLASEPRSLFWSTKEETDACYDDLANGLITNSWDQITSKIAASGQDQGESLKNISSSFPTTGLVLATHNLESCRTALQQRQTQASHGEPRVEMVYAQLQGMADHVTGELVAAAKHAETQIQANSESGQRLSDSQVEIPTVCKYLTWGSVGECSKYLVRRAEENRDAVARTVDARRALGSEVWRRIWRMGSV